MMESTAFRIFEAKVIRASLAIGLAFFIALAAYSGPYASQSREQGTLSGPPQLFDTPEQAADALIQAAEQGDVARLLLVLGKDGEDIISTGDRVADKNVRAAFSEKAREHKSISTDPNRPNRAILVVGADRWPLPIPIVKAGKKWRFDTAAGRKEIVARRVGRNELTAIEICRGYVEAQHKYASEIHDNRKPNQYAQQVISTPGMHDGLYWDDREGRSISPIGEIVAKGIEEGYTKKGEPFHGYYFKILKGQGPAAPLGELDFVVNGAMIGGFALAAAPAHYGVTGVQTFSVSHDGIVYQKDFGPDTLGYFQSMERYNPDKTWRKVKVG